MKDALPTLQVETPLVLPLLGSPCVPAGRQPQPKSTAPPAGPQVEGRGGSPHSATCWSAGGEGSGAGGHCPLGPVVPEVFPERGLRRWVLGSTQPSSSAPDPVTVLLGTDFKEINQRTKDDSCKHLELDYLQQQTVVFRVGLELALKGGQCQLGSPAQRHRT